MKKDNLNQLVNNIFVGVFGIVAIVYALTMFDINIFHYTALLDADLAAEPLLAREIWIQKSLIPQNWIASSEVRIFTVTSFASLLYGICSDANLAMGISSVIFGILILSAFYYLLTSLKVSKMGVAVAMTLLFCFPRAIAFQDLLWLKVGYYATHILFLFLSIGLYLRLIEEKSLKKISLRVMVGITIVMSFVLGCMSVRTFLMTVAGLLGCEGVRMFFLLLKNRKEKGFFKKLFIEERYSIIYVACILVVNLVGMSMPVSTNTPVSLAWRSSFDNLFQDVIPAIVECFGFHLDRPWNLLDSLTLIFLVLAVVYGIYVMFVHRDEKKVSFVWIAVFSACALNGALCITTMKAVFRYSCGTLFCVVVILTLLLDQLRGKVIWLKYLLLVMILVFAFSNYKDLYLDVVTGNDNENPEYQQIIDWMEENEYYYGYAEFANANTITTYSDGKVQVSGIADGSFGICKWLTSTNWYVPNLPQKMPTVYIISKSRLEAFTESFSTAPDLQVGFETDNYAIYESNTNYTYID